MRATFHAMSWWLRQEAEGPVLALRRDDPGLIWLALSAVREQLAH